MAKQRMIGRAAGYGGLAADAANGSRFAEAAQWYALAATWADWAGDDVAAQDYRENMRACVRAAGRP